MLLFTVKLIHSVILIYMLGCLLLIWHYGLTGLYERWLLLAVVSIMLEGLVWFGNGMRCPLTDWAMALGDETGADLLSEIILVQPVNVVSGYVPFSVLGLWLAGWRFWQHQKRNTLH
jgi:hypothetical protein